MISLRSFAPIVLAALAIADVAVAENKIAVIDSDRVVAESVKGQEAIAGLRKLEEQKRNELMALQKEIADLRKRIEDGAQALAADRLRELTKEAEDKVISLNRKRDDAQREFEAAQGEAFKGIEEEIIGVIDAVGREGGYTLIFNKFRSGLVYASETVDITEQVLTRYNQSATK